MAAFLLLVGCYLDSAIFSSDWVDKGCFQSPQDGFMFFRPAARADKDVY